MLKFSVEELNAFHTIETDSFSQVFLDMDQVEEELRNITSGTQEEIATCRALETPEAVNTCLDTLAAEFDLLKVDLLNRIAELLELGETALELSEAKRDEYTAGNREIVRKASQVTRSEFIRCVQSM